MQMISTVNQSIKLDLKLKQNIFPCWLQDGQFNKMTEDKGSEKITLKKGLVIQVEV